MLKSLISRISAGMSQSTVGGLLALPIALAASYALAVHGVATLTPAAQNALENGGPGFVVGILAGIILAAAATATVRSLLTLVKPAVESRRSKK